MDRITKSVSTLVSKYNTADPFQLADKLDIQVEFVRIGKLPLGKIIYDNDDPIVVINNRIKNKPVAIYTMAHELGHAMLQKGLIGYYNGAVYGHEKLELEADKFAHALLNFLYIEENKENPETINELATSYGLPTETLLI